MGEDASTIDHIDDDNIGDVSTDDLSSEENLANEEGDETPPPLQDSRRSEDKIQESETSPTSKDENKPEWNYKKYRKRKRDLKKYDYYRSEEHEEKGTRWSLAIDEKMILGVWDQKEPAVKICAERFASHSFWVRSFRKISRFIIFLSVGVCLWLFLNGDILFMILSAIFFTMIVFIFSHREVVHITKSEKSFDEFISCLDLIEHDSSKEVEPYRKRVRGRALRRYDCVVDLKVDGKHHRSLASRRAVPEVFLRTKIRLIKRICGLFKNPLLLKSFHDKMLKYINDNSYLIEPVELYKLNDEASYVWSLSNSHYMAIGIPEKDMNNTILGHAENFRLTVQRKKDAGWVLVIAIITSVLSLIPSVASIWLIIEFVRNALISTDTIELTYVLHRIENINFVSMAFFITSIIALFRFIGIYFVTRANASLHFDRCIKGLLKKHDDYFKNHPEILNFNDSQ